MTKSINLSGVGREQLPPPTPAAADTTSQTQVPPPAQLPPGVMGNPPLPTGRIVSSNANLTDIEKAGLEKVGWRSGEAIPANIQEQLAAVLSQENPEPALPVDPATPPTDIDPVAIDSLSLDKQAEVRKVLDEVLQTGADRPPVQFPQAASGPVTPEVAQKVAGAKQITGEFKEPERPATSFVPNKAPQPVEAATATEPHIHDEPPTATGTTGAATAATNCAHCSWPLNMPTTPEPDDAEKTMFVQAILGSKPFTKSYSLLGGRASFEYRTLAASELDAVFSQVGREIRRGEITTPADRDERLQRYRLYLQLSRFESGSFIHSLPKGLSKVENPNAGTYWETGDNPEDPLKLIEKHLLREVLPTATLVRLARQRCADFNRLVAKLEALADSPDFWQESGGQR